MQSVARFSQAIKTINANYPRVVTLGDDHYSNIGEFRNFLRSAVKGVSEYDLEPTETPRSQVMAWAREYKTRIVNGKCLVGSAEELKRYSLGSIKTVGLTVDAEVSMMDGDSIKAEDTEVLKAILFLHSKGYLEDTKFQLPLADEIEAIIEAGEFMTETHRTDTHIFIY